jgi:hypothetical protein
LVSIPGSFPASAEGQPRDLIGEQLLKVFRQVPPSDNFAWLSLSLVTELNHLYYEEYFSAIDRQVTSLTQEGCQWLHALLTELEPKMWDVYRPLSSALRERLKYRVSVAQGAFEERSGQFEGSIESRAGVVVMTLLSMADLRFEVLAGPSSVRLWPPWANPRCCRRSARLETGSHTV